MERPDDARTREAEDALERAARDSETLGSSAAARAAGRVADHFAGRDAPVENGLADPAEIWGRRIGRALSLVAVVVLAYWLGVQLKIW